MLLVGIASIYQFNEASDIATGNILTTTSSSYADVTGISISTSNYVTGDVLIILATFVVRADSGSVGRAIITVVDGGTPVDISASERTSDSAGTLLYATVATRYVLTAATDQITTVKLRGKRNSGAGNAYVSSPCTLLVLATRGKTS